MEPGNFKLTINKLLIIIFMLLSGCKHDDNLLTAQPETEVLWKNIDTIAIPLPPSIHPRLYINSTDAAEMGTRLKNPVLQHIVGKLISQSDKTPQNQVEWNAIFYLVNKDKSFGRNIIDSTAVLLKRTVLPDILDAARVTGRMMVTGAIVYDWLYPLLSTADKELFISELVRLAKTLECGYPPTKQGSVTGHSSESFVMRDMLSAGIAIYDEFPEMYEHAATRFFREHLPVRNWLYNGHAYHQGDSYGPHRFSWDTYPLMIFSKMGLDNIYNPDQQFVPYFYIYTTRPDGQRMRAGDTFAHSAAPGRPWGQYAGTLFAAGYYNDGILLEQFLRQGRSDGNENIFQFLWWNTELKPKPINDLPLSRYFGPPFGWMVARTGWDENSVIAEMKINEYNFTNHQHLDAGSFQIYYKGPLATESGLYSGTDGEYGSSHCKNYYWRTIAHNSLLIYDPLEKFGSGNGYGNDGGQRLPNNRSEPRNLNVMLNPANGYKTGEIIAHGYGDSRDKPDYTYLKGDITKAYSSKVIELKRSFVFLNLKNDNVPAALVIYDKIISSHSSYKKYWLLHSIEEPVLQQNKVTISHSKIETNGRLVNICLIPEKNNMEITSVGGPGKEFWVFGVNYKNDPKYINPNTYENAAWRIEISPVEPSQENYFLNIMQVMENHIKELDVKKVEGKDITGAVIADRIVFFSKTSDEINSSVNFSIEDEGSYMVLITDLAPGKWQIWRDDKLIVQNAEVSSEEKALYFEGIKGKYVLTKLLK